MKLSRCRASLYDKISGKLLTEALCSLWMRSTSPRSGEWGGMMVPARGQEHWGELGDGNRVLRLVLEDGRASDILLTRLRYAAEHGWMAEFRAGGPIDQWSPP